MFCTNCGKVLHEGVKFCGNCGTPVGALDDGNIIMPDMAAKAKDLTDKTGDSLTATESATSVSIEDAASTQTVPPASAKDFIPGPELYKFKMVEKTKGTSSMAVRHGIGTLHVYDNGLQFTSVLGADNGSGILRTITSTVINIAEGLYDPNTYPLEQIQELSVGKRMGIYNTLVITLKNGDVWSFCPTIPKSSAPRQIISILTPYMDKLNR